jgi:uridine kinase
MKNREAVIVGIAGGSGAGKTWLSERLASAFRGEASRISLDDFYRDRSHLSAVRRRRINYDHPRAIEWALLANVLRGFRGGRVMRVPRYDFASHSRSAATTECMATRLLLVEGLWILSRKEIRAEFDLTLYIDCPASKRLARRMARDVAERGRTGKDVRRQFETVTEPMHARYVAPQRELATVVLHDPISESDIKGLEGRVRELLKESQAVGRPDQPRAWGRETEWRAAA